ncbi:MAG: precorrin-3B C(17)-methyltransferase [Clostridia bacterium]
MKIYVVGIGAGNADGMTYEARKVLENADVIVGYTVYADLVKKMLPDKEYFTSAMKLERERCEKAVEMTAQGRKVAVICSGDAGVYGMASLVHEVAAEYEDIEVCVVAGVSAMLSGGALVGAPLGHDFAVISLSDLLTPWKTIEKRLECAAIGDFAVCLYNPSSKKRHDYLQKACDIMLRHRDTKTVCAIAKNIGRDGEGYAVMTLGELRDYKADMFTTVFIGNSQTREIKGKMVTPRGYKNV